MSRAKLAKRDKEETVGSATQEEREVGGVGFSTDELPMGAVASIRMWTKEPGQGIPTSRCCRFPTKHSPLVEENESSAGVAEKRCVGQMKIEPVLLEAEAPSKMPARMWKTQEPSDQQERRVRRSSVGLQGGVSQVQGEQRQGEVVRSCVGEESATKKWVTSGKERVRSMD
jgi:hypothetical protein